MLFQFVAALCRRSKPELLVHHVDDDGLRLDKVCDTPTTGSRGALAASRGAGGLLYRLESGTLEAVDCDKVLEGSVPDKE